MKEIAGEVFTGERPLFGAQDCRICNTIFKEGESPLKESRNVALTGCLFQWKYPLWYAENVTARRCTWFTMARAGVWYTNDVSLTDCAVEAPKNFRRCRGVNLQRVSFADAAETLWSCRDVTLNEVTARGDYFAMNSENMTVDHLTLYGNYSFDGAKNVEIRNSHLLSKDAFWNSENVTVRDSIICGEYLGWNAKNLTLINCTIESLQGLCYIDRLTMRDCRLLNTTLAFEYSTVDAQITGHIDSVLNPTAGEITADSIGELIIEPDRVDPAKTRIVCREGGAD